MTDPGRSRTGWVHRMVQHMVWADRRILEALRSAVPETVPEAVPATKAPAAPNTPPTIDSPSPAVACLAHVLAAEEIWLLRIRNEDPSGLPVWPSDDLAGCEVRAKRVHGAWSGLAVALEEEKLAEQATYRTSSGIEHLDTTSDIVSHLFLHGAHHRGQIVRRLRDAGHPPVNVDFITFVREEQVGRIPGEPDDDGSRSGPPSRGDR